MKWDKANRAQPLKQWEPEERGSAFVVRFDGPCAECGLIIEKGSEAIYDGKMHHIGACPREPEAKRPS